MSRRVLTTIVLVGILITLAGCGEKPTPTPEPTTTPLPTGVIVVGKVSDKPTKKIEEYQPLADHLAAKLGHLGIGLGEVKVARDLETMIRWMASGEVDLFIDNPYAALFVSDGAGGQPILYRVKEGDEDKHAVFFARADSGLTSLADLKGHVFAMEEPDSTSGYMLPLAYAIEAGMNPVEKAGPDSKVAEDEVGYAFSHDDDNTVQWVLDGRLTAGVTDNQAFEEFSEENPGALIVLAETEAVTRSQLVIARPGMGPALLGAIRTLLMALDGTEEGQAVMEPSETRRFAELSEETGASLARIREMYELVQRR